MAGPISSLFLLFLAGAAVSFLSAISAIPFDYPTANLSTFWTIGSSLTRNITYYDGSAVLPLLLRGVLGPSFSFGFFCSNPCSSFLLSIYIVYTNSVSMITRIIDAPPQVIWSANRDRPVRLNATLLFTPTGDLILRDEDGSLVWSTNTSGQGATSLTLLDSGNLVLMDDESSHLWASFDHPTDSLLVGQSLKQGQRLTSNSSTKGIQGQFYLTVDSNGLRAFIDSNPSQLYYAKPVFSSSKQQNRSAYATFKNGSLEVFVLFAHPNLSDYSIFLPTVHSAQYMRLDSNGILGLYTWNDGWLFAHQVFEEILDDCNYPTVCRQYGICSKGQCSCPQMKNGNFSYFTPVNPSEINLGCDPVTSISCQSNESHQLLALDEVSYFNYIDQSAAAMQMIDEKSCKQACLNNCSCKAAFFQYGGDLTTGSCYLPSEIFSLMNNNPQTSHYNSSAFLKVQSLSVASASPSSPVSAVNSRRSVAQKKKIIIGVLSGSILAGILALVFIFIHVRRRRNVQQEDDYHFGESLEIQARFSYEELRMATENFRCMLGKGGFGTVYEGTLNNGTKVAVKRLDGVGRAKTEFLAEMKTLVVIHHINLVRLIGFCTEKEHRLLVFEFMPNGSLDKWIFDRNQNTSLDWQTKCKIIADIARGLSYLHDGCKQRIAHLDIKPQNILLDCNFNAKVADFGLAKLIDRDQDQVMTRMRGTFGYLAPEWLTSVISEKVDVYSFGIVVMEIVCGRKNLSNSQKEPVHLIAQLREKIRDDRILDMIEERNSSNIYMQYKEEAVAMLKLAMWCLQAESSRRPSMSTVVKVLEDGLSLETNLDYNFFTSTTLNKINSEYLNASTMPIDSLLSGPR